MNTGKTDLCDAVILLRRWLYGVRVSSADPDYLSFEKMMVLDQETAEFLERESVLSETEAS